MSRDLANAGALSFMRSGDPSREFRRRDDLKKYGDVPIISTKYESALWSLGHDLADGVVGWISPATQKARCIAGPFSCLDHGLRWAC
jgi:hypothetical protein